MKKLSIVLILIIVLILSSCASVGNDVIDGNAYDYYETYEVENNIYDIYLPQAPEDVIYYSYEVSKTKTDKSTWTINYIYSGKYHVDEERESQEIWISLYKTLASSKDKLEELCCFEIELYNPYDTFEREITLVNNTKNIISYVVVDIYLPIKIHNKSSNEYYIVGVPVNNKFLIKTDTHVQSPKTLEFILWEDFLAIPNMKKN